MDSLTFTINFKDLNEDLNDNEDELKCFIGNLRLLFKFLMNANSNYYLIGNMLNDQLDKQVEQHEKEAADPVESMQKHLKSVCPLDVHGDIASAGFWKYFDDLYKSIGGAPMAVAYAAYKLVKYIEEQTIPAYKKEHDAGVKWVWDFVKYYDENWEAE